MAQSVSSAVKESNRAAEQECRCRCMRHRLRLAFPAAAAAVFLVLLSCLTQSAILAVLTGSSGESLPPLSVASESMVRGPWTKGGGQSVAHAYPGSVACCRRLLRFKVPSGGAGSEDPTPDYMNVLSMIFSMCGLMMKIKWAAWVALFCSSISFANSRVNDDTKQILSSFMLSISAVVMSYLQNPMPMLLPWSSTPAP